MKRVLFILLALFVAVGLATAWWVTRDTPQTVLRDGFRALASARTVESLVLDIAWTDPVARTTTGVGFAGQVDMQDVSHMRLIGVVRSGEGLLGPEQTADIIVDRGRLAVRPHTVTQSSKDAFIRLTGTSSTIPFAVLDLTQFVKSKGLPELAKPGSATETQAVISSFPSLIQPAGDWTVEQGGGGKIVSVPFQLDRNAIRPFLIALYKARFNGEPNAKTLVAIDQAVDQLRLATFVMTVDRRTREPLALQVAWTVLDTKGNEKRRIRVRLDLRGINGPVSISIPKDAIDITPKVVKPNSAGLPSAGQSTSNVIVPYQAATSTGDTNRFDSYVEDLGAKHEMFRP